APGRARGRPRRPVARDPPRQKAGRVMNPAPTADAPTADIPTPSLVVDVEVLRRNISSLHERLAGLGVRVRPHVKTHKSLQIAREQLAAGASGLTVATVGEAGVFAAVCQDLFVAYPLWPDADQLAVLSRLSETTRIAIGTD